MGQSSSAETNWTVALGLGSSQHNSSFSVVYKGFYKLSQTKGQPRTHTLRFWWGACYGGNYTQVQKQMVWENFLHMQAKLGRYLNSFFQGRAWLPGRCIWWLEAKSSKVVLRIPTTQNPNTWLERVLKIKLVDYVNINFSKRKAGAYETV